jgi:hypothetical protein
MVIDQRNAGASGTANSYTVDRWAYFGAAASKGTWQQNAGAVTPPVGFKNYWGFTSSSAYSVGATQQFNFYQPIEGFNVSDLGWGATGAATVTLSFWVRSSLTGTFGGAIYNSAVNRSYPFSYTISSANTWEQKTVTIAGDMSGTWLTTNGIGLYVNFSLGAGSTVSGTAGAWTTGRYDSVTGAVSVVGTSGATFYITGVQLEKGSVATSFDQRAYSQELAMCQRYCQTWASGEIDFIGSNAVAGNNNTFVTPLKATFRASPTWASTTFTMVNGTISTFTLTPNSFSFNVSNTSAGQWRATSTTLGILSAEL